MELKHLTTFLSVARHLNFTRAAQELGYVQSSVTAHIKALEADLEVPLFERLGRRVALTDSGRELCGYAQVLVGYAEQTREAVQGASDDPGKIRGTLRIAAPESLCAYRLPPVLRALQDTFPQLRVAFGPAGRPQLLASLAEGTLDVGFLLEESVENPMVHAEFMMREPMRLVARPEHRLAARERVRTVDLGAETLLLIEEGCAQRTVMDRELRRFQLRPPTMEFVSVEALKRCASAGLGVAMLPAASVADEVRRGELAELRWDKEPVLEVFFVRHKDRSPTRVLQELSAIAREHWAPVEADGEAARAAPTTDNAADVRAWPRPTDEILTTRPRPFLMA
ncbi:LysR family transcriptional regulator, partial [Streptomyces daliensis]|nr:LysR family transcriptional regulator [Streptomyces daliensis]